MNAPKGIGVYARWLQASTHDTPEQMARTLSAAGVSWVAFLACWQERTQRGGPVNTRGPRDLTELRRYAAACQAVGIDVWVWGFPWIGYEAQYFETIRKVIADVPGVLGVVHDPEVSYKATGKQAPRGSRGQAEALDAVPEAEQSVTERRARVIVSLDAQMVADLGLRRSGITSYGMATWHRVPWAAFASGGAWGSPQLYSVDDAQVDQGLSAWREKGYPELVPSVPLFGPNGGRKLDAHLSKFVNDGGEPEIKGFVFWSYQQANALEWKTIRRWAEYLKGKSCVPSP